MYKATFDRVVQAFSREPYAPEFYEAREEFFRRTGKVFEDEPVFETRMNAFLEWYLLDRCLKDSGVPPIRLHRLKHQETLEEQEVEILRSLEKSVHSLFLVTGVEEDRYRIRDFRTGEEAPVSGRHPLSGVHRGDFLDARVLPVGDRRFFTDAFWIHPSDASGFLTSESEKRKNEGLEGWRSFLLDLAYMKLKRERYAHVPTEQIYDWGMFQRDRAEAERRSADAAAGG